MYKYMYMYIYIHNKKGGAHVLAPPLLLLQGMDTGGRVTHVCM